jgi:hypothetical protein
MFKSQQHRAKAAEYAELIRHSSGQPESRKLQQLQERHDALADNERNWLTTTAPERCGADRTRGVALRRGRADVSAAIIMQWNALPKTLQQEIFIPPDRSEAVGTASAGRSPDFCTSTEHSAHENQQQTRDRTPPFYRDGTMRARSPMHCRYATTPGCVKKAVLDRRTGSKNIASRPTSDEGSVVVDPQIGV